MSQFCNELNITLRFARSLSGPRVRAFRPRLTPLKAFPGVIATGDSEAKRPLEAVGFAASVRQSIILTTTEAS